MTDGWIPDITSPTIFRRSSVCLSPSRRFVCSCRMMYLCARMYSQTQPTENYIAV